MTSLSKESGAIPPDSDGTSLPESSPDGATPSNLHSGARHRVADQVFRNLAVGSGFVVSLVIGLIALFLLAQAIPSLAKNEENFFTYTGDWITSGNQLAFGIPQLFYATVVVSVIALLIAMPVALGISIFLTEYAPKRLVGPITYTVDLLAAVPSIVYGLWGGILVLGPRAGAGERVARRPPRFPAVLPAAHPGREHVHRWHAAHRGHRARGHDPADHHRGHP